MVLLAGCFGNHPGSDPVPTIPRENKLVTWHAKAGEPIDQIAAVFGVSADDLRAWNGLEGDVIVMDQALVVWHRRTLEAPVAKAKKSNPKPRSAVEPDILDVLDQETGLDRELLDMVGALTRYGDLPQQGVHQTTQRQGIDAEGMGEISRAVPEKPTKLFASGPVKTPSLAKPLPKQCLPEPTYEQLTADDGVLSGTGLSKRQISSSMGGFIHHLRSCVPDGSYGEFALTARMTVGCDGRVIDAEMDGPLPPAVGSCMESALQAAAFPAHDLPDGLTFEYPIRLTL